MSTSCVFQTERLSSSLREAEDSLWEKGVLLLFVCVCVSECFSSDKWLTLRLHGHTCLAIDCLYRETKKTVHHQHHIPHTNDVSSPHSRDPKLPLFFLFIFSGIPLWQQLLLFLSGLVARHFFFVSLESLLEPLVSPPYADRRDQYVCWI